MSQPRWGRVGITINQPCHAAVACNEELVVRWLQSNPCEPREMADLKVPSLDMKHFEMIITPEDPFPTTLAIRMQLFLCGNFTANACVRVFNAHCPHSIADCIEPWWRRFHYFTFTVERRLIHPLLHNIHPTRGSSRLPRQKATYLRWNRATSTDRGGCKFTDRYRSPALNFRKVGFDCCVRFSETTRPVV